MHAVTCPRKKISISVIIFKRYRLKIALIQMNAAWEEKKKNLARAEQFFRKAAREACDVIVFPEMFNTGYSMNIPVIAEDEGGETSRFLSACSRKYSINVLAGFAVRPHRRKKPVNLAAAFDRTGAVIARYAKTHPFSFAQENRYFSCGSTLVTFPLEGIPVSIFICYDLRFPEVFRAVAREVRAVFVLANWPSSRRDHWETLLKARAIENQCFVIGVNRTGKDGNGISYPGASQIFDPLGKNVCTGDRREQYLTCEIDPEEVPMVRSRFPFLDDMRY